MLKYYFLSIKSMIVIVLAGICSISVARPSLLWEASAVNGSAAVFFIDTGGTATSRTSGQTEVSSYSGSDCTSFVNQSYPPGGYTFNENTTVQANDQSVYRIINEAGGLPGGSMANIHSVQVIPRTNGGIAIFILPALPDCFEVTCNTTTQTCTYSGAAKTVKL